MKKNGSSENTFWGHIPIFSPERPTYFFRGYDKLIEEFSERGEGGCHLSSGGCLTHNTPPKHQKTHFSSISQQKGLTDGGFKTPNIFL
jgi:hypothetical protein